MNSSPAVERRWSPQRWLAVVTALFLGQADFAWWLADRTPMTVRRDMAEFRARQLPATADAGRAALLRLLDPTLFVLPGATSFSGRAWLKVPPLDHRPAGWSEPPRWLALRAEELLTDLNRFGATNQPAWTSLTPLGVQPKDRPRSAADHLKPAPGTRFDITGDLTRRDLRSQSEFPVVAHAGLLPPTIIAVDVDQRGRVFQVSVVGSSGSTPVDQSAAETARTMLFAAAPEFSLNRDNRDFEKLRRARVVIHWWTQPPPAGPATTNAPAASPSLQPLPLP